MTIMVLTHAVLAGLVSIAASPFFYAGCILAALQYRRLNAMERQLFSVRATNWKRQWIQSASAGLGIGLLMSVLLSVLRIRLTSAEFAWLWGISLLLFLAQTRFICFSYAAGAVSLIFLLLNLLPAPLYLRWLPALGGIDLLRIADLLEFVAILHLAEAALVALQGSKSPTPLFLLGKRGQAIGAMLLSKYWPVPMSVWMGGAMVPLPAVLAYSGLSVSSDPVVKAKRTSLLLTVYSLLLFGLAWAGGHEAGLLLWLAAAWAVGFHEWLYHFEKRQEGRTYRYVQSPRGLRILAVLPGGPAEQMELKSGEMICKVNRMPVHTRTELHQAIQLNPAFSKLEVENAAGELRFVQRPRFEGEHHALGIIAVPEESDRHFVQWKEISIYRQLLKRWKTGSKPDLPQKTETSV